MSLSAVRLIANIASPDKSGLLDSFYSQRPATQGLYFRGDKNRLEFYPVSPADGSATMFWLPEIISTSSLQLGIGDADQLAESGTFDLSYDSEASTGIAYDVSAATLESTLNANAGISGIPDTVAVTLLATGIYQVAFESVGARYLLAGDPGNLTPESNVFASRMQTGDATTKEVQLLQIVQRPYVYVSSWTSTSAAAVTLTEIRAGATGVAALYEIDIAPLPYAGSFTIAGSSPLAYNGSQADWQSAAAGWNVIKTGDARLTVERTVTGTYTLTTGDVDVSGLSVFTGLTGTLGFNAGTLFKRFLSEPSGSFQTTLEAVYSDGTIRSVLLHIPVTLTKEILSGGSLAPSNWNGGFYTKSEIDSLLSTIDGGTP